MVCEDRMHEVRTSIIIVTYNNRADIDTCLDSLRQHSPDVEIIVVDNLSTDGTLAHVRQRYPHVTAVSSGNNGGFGAGVNIGATIAHGRHLAVLNPDTKVEADWLEPLINTLEQHPGVGLVTPTILLAGSDGRINACGNNVHLTGLTFCAGLNGPAPAYDAPTQSVGAISGAAFIVTRTVWERLDGFDEDFFMYLEDTDLSLRARRLGYDILHVPASRVWHCYTMRIGATKLYHLERNRLLMLRKNFSPATLALLAPALILTEALTWAFCARNGRAYLVAKWRSYRDFWGKRHSIVSGVMKQSRGAERRLLRTLSARLVVEQLQEGVLISVANLTLTAFYALWRGVMLALPHRAHAAPDGSTANPRVANPYTMVTGNRP